MFALNDNSDRTAAQDAVAPSLGQVVDSSISEGRFFASWLHAPRPQQSRRRPSCRAWLFDLRSSTTIEPRKERWSWRSSDVWPGVVFRIATREIVPELTAVRQASKRFISFAGFADAMLGANTEVGVEARRDETENGFKQLQHAHLDTMADFDSLSDVTREAREVGEDVSRLTKMIKDVFRYFSSLWSREVAEEAPDANDRQILIIGPGGVGKTTLARQLAGEYQSYVELGKGYEESLNLETLAVADSPGVEMVVVPGQANRREMSWPTLLDEVRSGRISGIMLTMAYGYHAIGDYRIKDHPLFRVHNTPTKFVRAYTEERRKEEGRVVNEVIAAIAECKDSIWLLLIVTKEDLWLNEASAVKEFYASLFENISERCRGSKRPDEFRCETSYASLVIRNFTAASEILTKTAAGYDQVLQVESLRRLLLTVGQLLEWENRDESS